MNERSERKPLRDGGRHRRKRHPRYGPHGRHKRPGRVVRHGR